MGNIKVLSQHVANKIAAGEVVERPASIIKELIENAIDAQSTQIDVQIKNGGISLIRIADNGIGMDDEDAHCCIQRHATSKINSIGDIFNIQSFGFRGEALPSIAAVSRLTITTRPEDKETGTKIQIEGGEIVSTSQTGCAQGTIIEMTDLFFNTPARRKFLKKEKTELGYIEDIFVKLALAHYNIGFTLRNDQNVIYELPVAQTLFERLEKIKGPQFCRHLVEIKEDIDEKHSFHGFIAMPSLVRANRSEQYFFVNGRTVKNAGFNYALTQGYYGLIPSEKAPVAVLFFDLDPKHVDINVHPTKREVRISNEKTLKTRLTNSIRNKLTQSDIFKRISFSNDIQGLVKEINDMTQESRQRLQTRDRVQEAVTRFYQTSPQAGVGLENMPAGFSQTQLFEEQKEIELNDLEIIGQFKQSYILAQSSDDLIIIDQHAAHERVMYEKILKNFQAEENKVQQSIMPVTIELNNQEAAQLEEYLPMLNDLGFSINDFGNNTYTVDAVPAYIQTTDITGLMRDFIDQVQEETKQTDIELKKQSIAAALACKKRTVKANTALNIEQMQALIDQLKETEEPFTCPHARPTLVKMSYDYLQKQFGR